MSLTVKLIFLQKGGGVATPSDPPLDPVLWINTKIPIKHISNNILVNG